MAKGLNRFPKSARLHLRKEIGELFLSGKSIQAFPLRAVYKLVSAPGAPLQIAVSVPKRNIKLAVDRNRIKRQIRESFRLNYHETAGILAASGKRIQLMILYSGKPSPEYAVLESKIILILQRLQKITDEQGIV